VLVGSFSFSFCIGGTVGPILSGYLYDVSGSYARPSSYVRLFPLLRWLVIL